MIDPTKGEYVMLVFKAPKGCGDCPLNDFYNDCCKASKKSYGNSKIVQDRRPDFCPLRDIYTDDTVVFPTGMVVHYMKDPGDCNSCLVNDFWGHRCRVTGNTYTYEELHSGHRMAICPMMDLYRDGRGSFKVM